MKKYLSTLFLTTLMLPLSSVADDAHRVQKLELVKSIYQSYSLDKPGEITDKKFTKDFYSVWKSDTVNQEAGGAPCIGADPVIDGQDFDAVILKKTLKVKYLPNGKVEATFRQFNFDKKFTAVRFAIECSGNKCLVDEIFYKDPDNPNQWFSFKKGLRKCIADDIAERKQERQKKLNAMQSKKPATQYNRKTDSGCSCASGISCIGPRGGRYCITSGGNKRYY